MTTVVWFKRDLRMRDHGPLAAAVSLGEPVIPLYVIEDDYWRLPDTSGRQWGFIRDSLEDLDRQLRTAGSRLLVMRGSVVAALQQLRPAMESAVFSAIRKLAESGPSSATGR